ncbi:MAG TPA: hypothetical protein VF491_08495, partial [Vicinamibacterales bacterium]
RIEALLFGVVVPSLLWFDRRSLARGSMRLAIVALLVAKIAGLAFTPQGLCARFSTTAPLLGETHTIPIDEPEGWLRSWDVRANWRDRTPACTAIVDRSYANAREFPAWFVNLLDSIRPGRQDLSLDLSGSMHVSEAGVLTLARSEGMRFDGQIGGMTVDPAADLSVSLPAGDHPVRLHAAMTGDQWSLQPRWNGRDAWSAATFTVAVPTPIDRAAMALGVASTLLAATIVGWWLVLALIPWRSEPLLLAWSAMAAIAMAFAAANDGIARIAAVALIAGVAVPVMTRHRNLRAAFLLLGVPWLAFFAVRAWPDIGAFTGYSHDDWLAYQVAGYRIFMGGYWLEGGNTAFDYQPLYRWISGALHMLFGDSSAGEIIVDASALLTGSLLAFWIVKATAGFRWGIAAGAATLITFATGTTWYFVGRGLSETVGSGFGFLAAFLLLRGRLGRRSSIAAAGIFAVLMFYTRLNFGTSAVMLAILLLSLRVPTLLGAASNRARHVRFRLAVGYGAAIAAGVLLFMTRTWWYTGHFSVLYGTSLKNNDIGLRAGTFLDAAVWGRIRHSVASLIFMNEPPHLDVRALFVTAGIVVVSLAALQMPALRRLPLALTLVTFGMCLSALVVHTHNYPGRMSIPLVPFACAAAFTGARLLTMRRAS